MHMALWFHAQSELELTYGSSLKKLINKTGSVGLREYLWIRENARKTQKKKAFSNGNILHVQQIVTLFTRSMSTDSFMLFLYNVESLILQLN